MKTYRYLTPTELKIREKIDRIRLKEAKEMANKASEELKYFSNNESISDSDLIDEEVKMYGEQLEEILDYE